MELGTQRCGYNIVGNGSSRHKQLSTRSSTEALGDAKSGLATISLLLQKKRLLQIYYHAVFDVKLITT